MSGIAQLALGAAPIAGGALLAAAAGQIKGPDFRGMLKADLDLLDRIPADQAGRRAELQRSIDDRIDDLIAASDKSRAFLAAAASYQGNWRDVVLFLCAVLFTVVWWNVNHARANWVVMFVVMIALSVLTGIYAVRGALRAFGSYLRGRGDR
jgi:hypothetical protein